MVSLLAGKGSSQENSAPPPEIFKISNHLLIVGTNRRELGAKVVVTVMANKYLEHFLSYYNKKFERIFVATQKCSPLQPSEEVGAKRENDQSSQILRETMANLSFLIRNHVKNPKNLKVFFSTKLRDFESARPRNKKPAERKPSLNTTQDKGCSRDHTANLSRAELSANRRKESAKSNELFPGTGLPTGLSIRNYSAINRRDQLEIPGLDHHISLSSGPWLQNETIEGGLRSRLRKLSQTGQIDFFRRQGQSETAKQDFVFLNMKYHEDLTRSVQTDQLDEYVFSKNHSINAGFEHDMFEEDITLISQFDCVINLQKSEDNLNHFYSCFALQVPQC